MAGPSGWGPIGSGGGGATGVVKKLGTFGARGQSPLYTPPSGAGDDPSSGATPGTYDVNILDPGSTYTQAAQESEDFLGGLKNALFGTSAPDTAGKHGGLLGDTPLVGPLTRAVSETVANVGGAVGTVGKGVLDVTGGALEHIDFRGDPEKAALKAQFDRIPQESVAKAEAVKKIAADPGAAGHYMASAVKATQADLSYAGELKPDATAGLFQTPGSAADVLDNMFGFLGLTQRATERTLAGMAKSSENGMDRVDAIIAVGNGEFLPTDDPNVYYKPSFNEDKGILGTGLLQGQAGGGLNAIEAIVYQKYGDGEWTKEEALDFLASHGAGISHNTALQIAGSLVDPQVVLGLGAAGVTRLAQTGAKLASATATGERAVMVAERALAAAKGAKQIAKATTELDEAKALLKSVSGPMRQARATSKLNVLGKMAETDRGTDIVRALYKVYEPLQAMHIDGAAKIARSIIDPLSGFTLKVPGREKVLDLMTTAGTRIVIGAYGDGNHLKVLNTLAKVTPGDSKPLLSMFSEDIGTYAANTIRTAGATYQRDTALANQLGDALAKTRVGDNLEDLVTKADRPFEELVMKAANSNRIHSFDEVARVNLSDRLASLYKTLDSEGWGKVIKDFNDDQLGLLHAATYGRGTKLILAAVEASNKAGSVGKLAGKMNRLILLNVTTLTRQGADGIVSNIKLAKTVRAKAAVVRAAQQKYPSLRGFTLDSNNLSRSVERFADELERTAEAYPMQVMDDELAELGQELQDLHRGGAFTLGFAPEDEFKWGLARTNKAGGKYAPVSDVWVDHVAPGLAMGYRPVWTRVATNVAGTPIYGAATKLAKPIDIIDAGIHTMGRRISGTIIAESARKHFVAKAVERFGAVGITDEVAEAMMRGLDDAVQRNDLVVRPSGLTTSNMWEAAESFIPKAVKRKDFDRRDLLALVLEAYKGDLRHVGVTQALSSRIKRVLSLGGNNASVLAEQVYPFLKFRLNVIFQAQEKIEPYILNSARGITPARGAKMSEADKATARLLDQLAQRSLVSNADHEMSEYAGLVLHGGAIERIAKARNTALGKISGTLGDNWAAISEVRGVKRVNMLRTFRAGLGKELRSTWEMNQPGVWDDMFLEAQRKAGRLLDEDEFAVSIMAEHMMGNDVLVRMVEGQVSGLASQFDNVDYKAAVATGAWHTPASLGELGTLDLDTMAEMAAFPVGRAGAVSRNQGDLRAAIAAGELKAEDVSDFLRSINADPDYIQRVDNALKFSWPGFMGTLKYNFNLSNDQVRVLEDMLANAAALRGATPIDYISQIFSPYITNGGEGAVGELGKLGKLAKITAIGDAGETPDDLIRQLSEVFSAHLDPSAKRALLMEFDPELRKAVQDGTLRLDLADIDNMWLSNGTDHLSESIINEMKATDGDYWNASLPRTQAEYDAEFPAQNVELDIVGDDGTPYLLTLDGIGEGLRNTDPELRDTVISVFSRFRREFPDIPIGRVDVVDLDALFAGIDDLSSTQAVTIGTNADIGTILFNKKLMGADWKQQWAEVAKRGDVSRTMNSFDAFGSTRISNYGADYLAGRTPEALIRHELGHVVDQYIRAGTARTTGTAAAKRAAAKKAKVYDEFVAEFNGSPAARMLSEYANESADEAMGELFGVALDRNADLAGYATRAPAPVPVIGEDIPFGFDTPVDKLDEWLNRVGREYPEIDLTTVQGAIGRSGNSTQDTEDMWYAVGQVDREIRDIEGITPDYLNPFKKTGPQTVEEAVTQLRTILTDAGIWKPGPASTVNPDVIRAHQMFAKWTKAVVGANLKDPSAPLANIMSKIDGFPTTNAVPYNYSEHQLLTAATTAMKAKWDDAHRLQYYARQRTMLERSINHPMFGIYPASYMWGKMLPEIIRFVTKEPFGVRTGAMAYGLLDVQRALALQREFDPEFDKKIEALGHSPSMFALNYMLPAVPWEANANWPAWVRAFGKQGMDMQSRVEAGGTVNTESDLLGTGLNPIPALQKASNVINPLLPVERSIVNPIKEMTPDTEVAPAQSSIRSGADTPVPASELSNPLGDALQQLTSILGG